MTVRSEGRAGTARAAVPLPEGGVRTADAPGRTPVDDEPAGAGLAGFHSSVSCSSVSCLSGACLSGSCPSVSGAKGACLSGAPGRGSVRFGAARFRSFLRRVQAERAWGRWAVRLPILAYRYAVSPLLGPHCRFYPTCSGYALEALDRHGVLRGAVLMVFRFLRCHPWWTGPIHDPVPERFAWREAIRYKRKRNGTLDETPDETRDGAPGA